MQTKYLLAAAVALVFASPAVAATGLDADAAAAPDCSGTPSDIPFVDGLYQAACNIGKDICDLFDPCPISF